MIFKCCLYIYIKFSPNATRVLQDGSNLDWKTKTKQRDRFIAFVRKLRTIVQMITGIRWSVMRDLQFTNRIYSQPWTPIPLHCSLNFRNPIVSFNNTRDLFVDSFKISIVLGYPSLNYLHFSVTLLNQPIRITGFVWFNNIQAVRTCKINDQELITF